MEKICFIGAGNMGQALMGSIFQEFTLFAVEPDPQKRNFLEKNWHIQTFDCVQAVADWSIFDAVVLAIKPQQLKAAVQSLSLSSKTLIISIVAGATTEKLCTLLKTKRCIRAMPNTPALVKKAVVGLFAPAHLSQADKNLAHTLFNALGFSFWVEHESDMNSVTALSGSGPAYVFYFLECLQNAAQQLGFTPDIAQTLAFKTLEGAAQLAQNGHFAQLRHNVTSKGGTTEAALHVLERCHFQETIEQAVQAAKKKSEELAKI